MEDYRNLWEINVGVAIRLCKGIMPFMAQRKKGKVINISSVLAEHPLPTLSAYSSSKLALIGFSRSIALQYAPLNVQVNVVAPGYLESEKHSEYFNSEIGRNFSQRFIPTGVVGKTDSINGIVLFLASGMSDHITGQVIKVDGGYSIW